MRGTIELQKSVSIKAVLAYIYKVYQPSETLVKDDGEYGLYQYEYLDKHDQWQTLSVLLDYIVPNYGGVRYMLVCRNCERRVLRLYLATPNFAACRHCLNLEYGSRQFQHNPLLLSFSNSRRAYSLVYRRQVYAGKPTPAGKRMAKYVGNMRKCLLPYSVPEW